MLDIDKIVTNAINKVLNESMSYQLNEDARSDIAAILSNYYKNKGKSKNSDNSSKPNLKVRKKANGGSEYYDYSDYEEKNKKITPSDADSIRKTIDTEKTNMAAIARILFPDHTEEGAQSQFRKIINGERPMTKKIANRVLKMISRGEIAVN